MASVYPQHQFGCQAALEELEARRKCRDAKGRLRESTRIQGVLPQNGSNTFCSIAYPQSKGFIWGCRFVRVPVWLGLSGNQKEAQHWGSKSKRDTPILEKERLSFGGHL